MNPVIGLDISKGESQVQAFLDKGNPYSKSFKVSHTLEGLASLIDFLEEVKVKSGMKPPVVLEATGHYQTPVVQYLEDRGYLLIIINPLISIRLKVQVYERLKPMQSMPIIFANCITKKSWNPIKSAEFNS